MSYTHRVVPSEITAFDYPTEFGFEAEFNAVGEAVLSVIGAIAAKEGADAANEFRDTYLLPMLADLGSAIMYAEECGDCGELMFPAGVRVHDDGHLTVLCRCGHGHPSTVSDYDPPQVASRQGS